MRLITVSQWAIEADMSYVAVHQKIARGKIKAVEGLEPRQIDADIYPPKKSPRGPRKRLIEVPENGIVELIPGQAQV